MGLDHPDRIFGTILDVYAAAGSTRTNDFIDNSRPCDHIRKLCGSSHNTPKFVTRSLELRQELTCEQFVRGETDHELPKYDEDTVNHKLHSHRVAH